MLFRSVDTVKTGNGEDKHYDLNDESTKHKLVVFEEIYYVVPKTTKNHQKGTQILIATHKDTHDLKQTIEFPHGKTSFNDTKTKTHQALPEKKVKVVDTVYYHDLKPEHEYTVTGTLLLQTLLLKEIGRAHV